MKSKKSGASKSGPKLPQKFEEESKELVGDASPTKRQSSNEDPLNKTEAPGDGDIMMISPQPPPIVGKEELKKVATLKKK